MIPERDRYHIERKYHNPDEPFDGFRRRAYHGEGYLKDSGLDDEEILKGLQDLAVKTASLPHPVARAKALAYVMENVRLFVSEYDYFVGLYSLDRLANSTTFVPWRAESERLRRPETLQWAKDLNESGASANWPDYDHVVPDWDAILSLGFSGLLERARFWRGQHEKNGTLTEETAAFFEGIELEYSAIIKLIDRLYRTAAAQSHEKAPRIAACLKRLRDGAPQSFYEALQLIFLFFLISECIDSFQVRSLGNGLDSSLWRFYQRDLAEGVATEEEIRRDLSYFFLQWYAIGNYWGQPFYLGGTDREGKSKYNELSRILLEVYDSLEIHNPKIQIKVNYNTPTEILHQALDLVRRKNASLVFCCEPAMVRAIMSYGATWEEAVDYDIRGCYETGVRANEVSAVGAYVNAAKAVEYVFTNGWDATANRQVGLKTGNVGDVTSFEDFYTAFLKQWDHLIDRSIETVNDAERFFAFVNPSSMYSATIETSLKNGKDGYGGGVKFNNSALLNCSFASAVDSVLAVKEFVFEKKACDLPQMAQILKNNWQGHEKLRLQIRKSPHKYGSGSPVAEHLATAMADHFATRVNLTPNGRGGVYKAILHSARQYLRQGEKTAALPDGRRRGEELSRNASPVAGMDRGGVTALVRAVTALRPSTYTEACCLDVSLHPSAVEGEEGMAAFCAVLMTYLEWGGQSIQFNVLKAEELRDAQKNPEKYKNLQIRVCGWNTLWNHMTKEEQDVYILRAESAV